MKMTKLTTIALCAVACTVATMSAEGNVRGRRLRAGDNPAPTAATASDDIIDSATPPPTIADPVNPKPGVVFKGYDIRTRGDLSELPTTLEKSPTVKMTVVTDGRFSYGKFKDVNINQGVWEGYLKCKRSANCTVLVQQAGVGTAYVILINGQKFIMGSGQVSRTIDLKAGFNHFKIIGHCADDRFPVCISIKATESTKDPKPLTPKDMFYDEKPDEGDVF